MRIYIAAWPRSGTKHLGGMIASALGEVHAVGTLQSRGGRQPDSRMPAVMQTHFSALHGEAKSGNLFVGSSVAYRNLREDEYLIWNVRDPRDTAISLWQMGLEGGWLKPCTLAEYLESHFCAEVLNAPDFGPSISWGTYTRGWMEAMDPPLFSRIEARHEMTMANREGQLKRILAAMGFCVPDHNIKGAIAQMVGRQRLSYDGLDNYTEAGQSTWRRYFDPDAAEILSNHCGDLMHELGYGDELEWLELVRKVAE